MVFDLTQKAIFKENTEQLGVALTGAQHELLFQYIELLLKWNRTYNLTAITEPEQMLSHHLLDSLAISPYLSGETFLDVGAGGGLPGIPLAIANPGQKWVLLDSNGKKTRFLTQARHELGLQNIEIVNSRVEGYHCAEKFSTITSRAFRSIAEMIQLAVHLIAPSGLFLCMKSKAIEEELKEIPKTYSIDLIKELNVPGIYAPRYVVGVKQRS